MVRRSWFTYTSSILLTKCGSTFAMTENFSGPWIRGCGAVPNDKADGKREMKSLGRLLQVLGLLLLPVAMLMEMSEMLGRRGVAEMLLMLVAGAVAFGLGRLIEGYAR
jgi:hypothetical protein